MIPLALSDTLKADVAGIHDATCSDLPVCTCAAKIKTTEGYKIDLFHHMPSLVKAEPFTLHFSFRLLVSVFVIRLLHWETNARLSL